MSGDKLARKYASLFQEKILKLTKSIYKEFLIRFVGWQIEKLQFIKQKYIERKINNGTTINRKRAYL